MALIWGSAETYCVVRETIKHENKMSEKDIYFEVLVDCWKSAMKEWGRKTSVNNEVLITNTNGSVLLRFKMDEWVRLIDSVKTLDEIEQVYYEHIWNKKYDFLEFLEGHIN